MRPNSLLARYLAAASITTALLLTGCTGAPPTPTASQAVVPVPTVTATPTPTQTKLQQAERIASEYVRLIGTSLENRRFDAAGFDRVSTGAARSAVATHFEQRMASEYLYKGYARYILSQPTELRYVNNPAIDFAIITCYDATNYTFTDKQGNDAAGPDSRQVIWLAFTGEGTSMKLVEGSNVDADVAIDGCEP